MNAHFSLQAKGGIGKSLTMNYLAQYLLHNKKKIRCIDTDPANKTLMSIKKLKAESLEILKDEDINSRSFDNLMELILESKRKKYQDLIIDNGSSSHTAITKYLTVNDALTLLKAQGVEPYIHIVIINGQEYKDTIKGLLYVVEKFFDAAKIIVWKNERVGPIEHNGVPFEEQEFFKQYQQFFAGIVTISAYPTEYFAEDAQIMHTAMLTFNEMLNDKKYSIMVRNRIQIIRDKLFDSLSAVF